MVESPELPASLKYRGHGLSITRTCSNSAPLASTILYTFLARDLRLRKDRMRKSIFLALLALTFTFIGCEQTKTPPAESKPAPQAAEYETGRAAFQKLYVAARGFAPDVRPYRLQSLYTKDAPVQEGKAGIWSAQFASAARRSIKAYTWSGMSGEDMPERGVSHGTEDTYNPSNSSTRVWDIAFLKVDSDGAFKTAQEHGGEALTKKDPKQPVVYLLDWDPAKNELVWHVIYGTDQNDAKLRIAVDASSGIFLGKEH
jgi:hypothetical protein